ncbi:MAG: methylmalonyl-CoA epimerase [Syntrophobacterales bacterium]|nr:MAG: methylmalonyl-CoA epimerase [Syntrophobacterales bacterium]
MVKRIDHIAIAVNDIDEAVTFYTDVLKLDLSGVEVVTEQKTKVGFFKIGESNIELIQPASDDSPLVKFLETKGPGIHHICLEVDDIQREVEELKKRGARMIDENPRPGAHNTRVAFIHPKSSGGVLIELNQLPEDK